MHTQGHVLEQASTAPPPAGILREGDIACFLQHQPLPALLRRYMKEQKCDQALAEQAFVSTKQFLFACATAPHPCSPSLAIDGMWHEFLMFSKEYYDFCMLHFGKMIHHHPTERMMIENYQATRKTAERMFGPLDERFWPKMRRSARARAALCYGGDCSAGCES